jgi:hypothetical protein
MNIGGEGGTGQGVGVAHSTYKCTFTNGTYLTSVHEINYKCTCCLYGAVRNGFEAGQNPLRGALEGVGPEMATSEASAIWAQKS